MENSRRPLLASCLVTAVSALPAFGAAANFEASHVHPIALTPNGTRLLAVNTPDAVLEVFTLDADGVPVPSVSIPVGLEPVGVVARNDGEAWIVNLLSDSVSIVDLALGVTVRTLTVGNEPTDVAFAGNRAFVAVSQEDAVKVYDLTNLDAAPTVLSLPASRIRALAVSADRTRVYAVPQDSGNETTVVSANVAFGNNARLNATRLAGLGLNDMRCAGAPPPPYPPLPAGIVRNPALADPADGIPKVALIVSWDRAASKWKDETGQDWTHCLPFRLPDHDLFVIDAGTLAVTSVDHLGTSLFEVSVQPGTGRIWIPHTEARNKVRFEHALGVRGHIVDNRVAVVDPAAGNAVTIVDLNGHIDRGSNPATNLAERLASISQPGMMVWRSDGSTAYLTAIGSRKVFALSGACLTPACLFGPARATPAAVEVGDGPTGVALHEGRNKLYVLNRISNSIAVVDLPGLVKSAEVPMHDSLPEPIRAGRRFLYDAILGSGHGDAACSSCHLSGDKDGLAWDLGDPTGAFAPYSTALDNVRFVAPVGGQPVACDPADCAAHAGFDPQKGPMTTQTLRGMVEPLHWRGDRGTMNDFNPAFPGLMGTADVGPVNGKPAGLQASDMELFRTFALDMRFPPNPYRRVDDTLPDALVSIPGSGFSGNPTTGRTTFTSSITDAGGSCLSCHASAFGTAGGKLGGVTPTEPTSADAAALFNGLADRHPHSDLKIAHLRNLWDRPSFEFGPATGPYPQVKTGFGFTHDGSMPNLLTFLSFDVFNISPTQARDLASFMLHFPTGTKPATGRSLTLPAGPPPSGSPSDESLLGTLLAVGDLASSTRHCELTVATRLGGRPRSFRFSGGTWLSDAAAEPPRTTAELRSTAEGPITFLCAPIDSGLRLGGDRDGDAHLNVDDCGPADPLAWSAPSEVLGVAFTTAVPPALSFTDQSGVVGPGVRYDVVGGLLSALRSGGLSQATGCLVGAATGPVAGNAFPAPPPGEGYFYLVRASNSCGTGGFGVGRAALDPLACLPGVAP